MTPLIFSVNENRPQWQMPPIS